MVIRATGRASFSSPTKGCEVLAVGSVESWINQEVSYREGVARGLERDDTHDDAIVDLGLARISRMQRAIGGEQDRAE